MRLAPLQYEGLYSTCKNTASVPAAERVRLTGAGFSSVRAYSATDLMKVHTVFVLVCVWVHQPLCLKRANASGHSQCVRTASRRTLPLNIPTDQCARRA